MLEWSARLWQIVTYPLLSLGGQAFSLAKLAELTLVAFVTLRVAAITDKRLVRRWLAKSPLDPGTIYTISRFLYYGIILTGTVFGLMLLGFNLGSLAVLAGFLSIGIGVGLQGLTGNIVAGFVILFERPVKPGDRVTIGDHVGQVREVHFRTTTIVTNDNVAIIVPNAEITSQRVINWSYGEQRVRLHVKVGLSYDVDLDEARTALLTVARAHPAVRQDPSPDVWLTGFGESALAVELLVWIDEPSAADRIISELNFGILKACRARGVVIPCPKREIAVRGPVSVVVDGQA